MKILSQTHHFRWFVSSSQELSLNWPLRLYRIAKSVSCSLTRLPSEVSMSFRLSQHGVRKIVPLVCPISAEAGNTGIANATKLISRLWSQIHQKISSWSFLISYYRISRIVGCLCTHRMMSWSCRYELPASETRTGHWTAPNVSPCTSVSNVTFKR